MRWLLLSVLLVGCSRSEAPRLVRPATGDTVTPEIFLIEPWIAATRVQVLARLEAERDGEVDLIVFEDVPHEVVPRTEVVFFRDDMELSRVSDLEMNRDC